MLEIIGMIILITISLMTIIWMKLKSEEYLRNRILIHLYDSSGEYEEISGEYTKSGLIKFGSGDDEVAKLAPDTDMATIKKREIGLFGVRTIPVYAVKDFNFVANRIDYNNADDLDDPDGEKADSPKHNIMPYPQEVNRYSQTIHAPGVDTNAINKEPCVTKYTDGSTEIFDKLPEVEGYSGGCLSVILTRIADLAHLDKLVGSIDSFMAGWYDCLLQTTLPIIFGVVLGLTVSIEVFYNIGIVNGPFVIALIVGMMASQLLGNKFARKHMR